MTTKLRWRHALPLSGLLGTLGWVPATADTLPPKPVMTIERAAGSISIDGDISDDGWKGIQPITTWYETNPGDNVEPKVKNVAYLAYDDRYLYAAFEFQDPHPEQIRAP
ncbi:MAG: hypothetical protein ACRDL7_14590, partial [Gaiellaceae bacterium]